MEKAELLQALAAAKRRAHKSKAIVDFQRHAISKLIGLGKDTAEAESVLQPFEKAEADDLAEMQRILNALDAA